MEVEPEQKIQDGDLMPCMQYITTQTPPPPPKGKALDEEGEIVPLDEGLLMDIYSLTLDELQKKIIQERKKHFLDELTHPTFIK